MPQHQSHTLAIAQASKDDRTLYRTFFHFFKWVPFNLEDLAAEKEDVLTRSLFPNNADESLAALLQAQMDDMAYGAISALATLPLSTLRLICFEHYYLFGIGVTSPEGLPMDCGDLLEDALTRATGVAGLTTCSCLTAGPQVTIDTRHVAWRNL